MVVGRGTGKVGDVDRAIEMPPNPIVLRSGPSLVDHPVVHRWPVQICAHLRFPARISSRLRFSLSKELVRSSMRRDNRAPPRRSPAGLAPTFHNLLNHSQRIPNMPTLADC